jgi:hypothetical protein
MGDGLVRASTAAGWVLLAVGVLSAIADQVFRANMYI